MMALVMTVTEMLVIRTVTGADGGKSDDGDGGDDNVVVVVVLDSHGGRCDCGTACSASGFGSPNPSRTCQAAWPTFEQGASSLEVIQLPVCPAGQGQSHRSFLQLPDWQIAQYIEERARDHGCW